MELERRAFQYKSKLPCSSSFVTCCYNLSWVASVLNKRGASFKNYCLRSLKTFLVYADVFNFCKWICLKSRFLVSSLINLWALSFILFETIHINPIQNGGQAPLTSFSSLSFTNVGISPQNFLTFSLNPFTTPL